MGLDMYLERYPRFKDATPKQIDTIESLIELEEYHKNGKHTEYDLKEWHGSDDVHSDEAVEFYRKFYGLKYWSWDKEKKYGHKMISENVGSWRKANQIHNWFVKNIQDGEDDCRYHREVTKADLEHLLFVCKYVIEHSKLVAGKIENGQTIKNGKWTPILEDGEYIEDPKIAKNMLPMTEGFFFGGTAYDQYYIEDLEDTVRIIEDALATTDFETQMLFYCSSW